MSVVPRYARPRAVSTSGGATSARPVRSVHSDAPVARSRQRSVPSASPTSRRAPARAGGAVASPPEASRHRTRPLESSTAASPRPATSARSSSMTAASVPGTCVCSFQRTLPVRGCRLVSVPVLGPHEQDAVGRAEASREVLGLPGTSPVAGSSARTVPSRVATYRRWVSAASGGTTKSPSSVFQAAGMGNSGGRGGTRAPPQEAASADSSTSRAGSARDRVKAVALYTTPRTGVRRAREL